MAIDAVTELHSIVNRIQVNSNAVVAVQVLL